MIGTCASLAECRHVEKELNKNLEEFSDISREFFLEIKPYIIRYLR